MTRADRGPGRAPTSRDRRRSLLAWGLPLGLMSAFIVAIFPSVEDALSKAVAGATRRR